MTLPGALVSAEWLDAHLGEPGLAVADVRWSLDGGTADAEAGFERGHIPGAVFVDLDRDLARHAFTGGPGRHPLPAPRDFADTMSGHGIGDDVSVVVYDDVRGSIGARLWWMLDALDHDVALLDGGLQAWAGSLETGPSASPARAVFTARPWPAQRIADASDVVADLETGARVVLDARASERYRGEIEPIDRVPGHIPGALEAPWTDNLDPQSGRFLSPEGLRERFATLGVVDRHGAVVHCGSGVTSCHHALAMRVAGLPTPRLYVGSWSDWISDPRRPIATGPYPT